MSGKAKSPQRTNGPRQEPERMACNCFRFGRILIVCIDGTSNKFGPTNTNVIELYHIIEKDDDQQTWYNSGIGTYAQPSWKSWSYVKQVIDNKVDLAIAWNFERTIMGAYRWLSDKYRDGDRIFLFGFSRGAFQVRVLSAMIDKVGLIFPGNELQIPFAYELYADPKSGEKLTTPQGQSVPSNLSMAEHFKETFCRKNVKVHFVGAWDTVSSIGIARGKKLLPGTVEGMKHVCYFRHALALDERRVKFLPEYAYGGLATLASQESGPLREVEERHPKVDERAWSSNNGRIGAPLEEASGKEEPQIKEVWFAGTHSDIGGGNVDNPTMDRSRPPLRWMVFEAEKAGLRTTGFEAELSSKDLIEITESLTWHWWPLEIFPLERLTFSCNRRDIESTHRPHLGQSRKIHPGQKIHASVVLADPEKKYTPKARPPKNLLVDFWKAIPFEWLEVDEFDFIETVVNNFVVRGESLRALAKVKIRGRGRQALYDKIIKTLLNEEIPQAVRYQLLEFCVNFLHSPLLADPSVHLTNRNRLHPVLEGLKDIDLEDSNKVVKTFIINFTDRCVCCIDTNSGYVLSVAISPDGKRVASGSSTGRIGLWNTETGESEGLSFDGHEERVFSIAFSPDGEHIVSGSDDNTVRVWDVKTGKAVGKPLEGHTGPVFSVSYSPDGRLIASGSFDRMIRLWDARKGKAVGKPLEQHRGDVNSVAFSPDGKLVASGSDDRTIRLWSTETCEPVGDPFKGHSNSSAFLRFDGDHLVPASAVGGLLGGHSGGINSIAFSRPDGERIVSGSDNKTLRLWDVQTGKEDGRPFEGNTDLVLSVAFSPDGKRVVSGSADKTIRLWNTETREMEGPPFTGHTNWVTSVAFSTDGRRIASGSYDGTIRIWDVED